MFVGVNSLGGAIYGVDVFSPFTEITVDSTVQFFQIAFGNNVFVAVGKDAGSALAAYRSPDGITWTGVLNIAATANNAAITFDGTQFVVIKSGVNTADCYTSPDGITWTHQSSLPGAYPGHVVSIVFGNAVYVAGTTLAKVVTSPDLVTWTVQTTAATAISQIAFGGTGLFVSVGGDDTPYSSPDGVTWTAEAEIDPGNGFVTTCVAAGGPFGWMSGQSNNVVLSPFYASINLSGWGNRGGDVGDVMFLCHGFPGGQHQWIGQVTGLSSVSFDYSSGTSTFQTLLTPSVPYAYMAWGEVVAPPIPSLLYLDSARFPIINLPDPQRSL